MNDRYSNDIMGLAERMVDSLKITENKFEAIKAIYSTLMDYGDDDSIEDQEIVRFKKLDPYAVIPEYKTEGASGVDFTTIWSETFSPHETKVLKIGLAVEIPRGFELQIRPRSGITVETPFRIANSPGTIDSDYRGEIGIPVTNTGDEEAFLNSGTRIAQGVFCPVPRFKIVESKELSDTARGSGGFGSTGLN